MVDKEHIAAAIAAFGEQIKTSSATETIYSALSPRQQANLRGIAAGAAGLKALARPGQELMGPRSAYRRGGGAHPDPARSGRCTLNLPAPAIEVGRVVLAWS
jgi:hypothetical protein